MRVTRLSELPAAPARAVVINVGTELMTTLALASAKRHAAMPLLLVNCDPTPESSALFDRLGAEWEFDVVEAPRRTHGGTLDWLFEGLPAEVVLLLDSDAEIRSTEFIERMSSSFDRPSVFGAGFVEGPWWLEPRFGVTPRTCLFQERPFVPCVMLRTDSVRAALATGASFETRTIFNDVMWSERASRWLAMRFQNGFVPRSRVLKRLPGPVRTWLAARRFPALAWARRDFYGHRPNYVYCDTGADVYQWCRYDQWLVFAGTANALRTKDDVVHYKGTTRRSLGYGSPGIRVLDDLETVIVERLATVYATDWDEYARPERRG